MRTIFGVVLIVMCLALAFLLVLRERRASALGNDPPSGSSRTVGDSVASGFASVHAGKPEQYRVDIGQRSARLEVKLGDAWSGASDTHYFGSLTPELAAAWAAWARASIEGQRLPEPKVPATKKQEDDRKKRETKRVEEHQRRSGPGFYVTNRTTTSMRRHSEHDVPFRTLEEAIANGHERLAYFASLKLAYLLPVDVIESPSREAAEQGRGHVWWRSGKRLGAPVPPEQLRFEGIRTTRTTLPLLIATPGHPRRWWVEERAAARGPGLPGYFLYRNARGEWAVASTKDVGKGGIVMATFFGTDEDAAHDHFAFLAAPTE